jgi:tRNA (guanine37-N1)-methyltransferase
MTDTLEASDMSAFTVPPARRLAAAVLDRSLFNKTVQLSAAGILNAKNIGRYRKQLSDSNEFLQVERLEAIRPHPDTTLAAQGRKCMLLRPEVRAGCEFVCLWQRRYLSWA